MKTISERNFKISTLPDLARLIGAPGCKTGAELSRKFLRATNYDMDLEIVSRDRVEAADETWQVEIRRGSDKPQVRARQDGRGRWISNPEEMPGELRSFLRVAGTGSAVSRRSWSAWNRGRWMKPGWKRHRSKSGSLLFSMNLCGVTRKTGQRDLAVRLLPIAEEAQGEKASRILPMPFSAGEFVEAFRDMRAMVNAAALQARAA